MLYKHRHRSTQTSRNRAYTTTGWDILSGYPHTAHTDLHFPMLSSHYTPHAAMQADYMVEWMHDLRPVFEVHRGRGWELMDLCFMTCFTGTLPFSVTLAHLWFMLQILILFIQS